MADGHVMLLSDSDVIVWYHWAIVIPVEQKAPHGSVYTLFIYFLLLFNLGVFPCLIMQY